MVEDQQTAKSVSDSLAEERTPANESAAPVRAANRWVEIWESLLRMGLGEATVRSATMVALIVLTLVVVWVMRDFYLKADLVTPVQAARMRVVQITLTPTVSLPPFDSAAFLSSAGGVDRQAEIHTILPTQPRFDIEQYVVQKGDTVIGIAQKFGLQPQTILWGNLDSLADDPHRLQIGQKLNVLPLDGVLHEWRAGEGLNGIAKVYGVTPEDIIQWPGNHLSQDTIGDYAHPNIPIGTRLMVPGGSRPFISWSAPLMSRKDPAQSKIFGSGYCGTITDGFIGNGTFAWPTTEKYLSGYDFSPETNHWGIDIAGAMGNPIYATDSGVIVYAGWNDWGYGNAIVIDHGDGWQSLYGHLSQINVACGASVSQGATIGAMGSTGRSTGPHLHFELMNVSGVRVNPWSYLTK